MYGGKYMSKKTYEEKMLKKIENNEIEIPYPETKRIYLNGVYPSDYVIWSDGRVQNTERSGKPFLKPEIRPNGSLRVTLVQAPDIFKKMYIHHLVATAFIPNPLNATKVRFINGDRGNPHVENLEWTSEITLNNMENIILFTSKDNVVTAELYHENDTLWADQKTMAEIFDCSVKTINEHINSILREGELTLDSTITPSIPEFPERGGNEEQDNLPPSFRNFQIEGGKTNNKSTLFLNNDKPLIVHTSIISPSGNLHNVMKYNLDMIIAVGYRVNSKKATHFRQWATTKLRQMILYGFVIDELMLRNADNLGYNSVSMLYKNATKLRKAEFDSYQKLLRMFETVTSDYDINSHITDMFLKTIQNKFHYAITGMNAAEIVHSRVNPDHPTLGLMSWKDSPFGYINKPDVIVGKNYLTNRELLLMKVIVDYFVECVATKMAKDNAITMNEFLELVTSFTDSIKHAPIDSQGTISRTAANELAEAVYLEHEKARVSEFKQLMASDPEFAESYAALTNNAFDKDS